MSDFNKNLILKSKIGLNNAGESCYMASIIQILIHLEKFLDSLKQNYTKNKLYTEFYKFLKKIEQNKSETVRYYHYNYDFIEIKEIASVYHSINHKFKGTEGNNPMTFFNEFIKDLNKNILTLFKGEKEINLKIKEKNQDKVDKSNEDFIFYLITLDKSNKDLGTYFINNLNTEKEFENEKNETIIEKIKTFPEILVINLELEIEDYKPETTIYIPYAYSKEKEEVEDYIGYNLKAINKYSDAHSTA